MILPVCGNGFWNPRTEFLSLNPKRDEPDTENALALSLIYTLWLWFGQKSILLFPSFSCKCPPHVHEILHVIEFLLTLNWAFCGSNPRLLNTNFCRVELDLLCFCKVFVFISSLGVLSGYLHSLKKEPGRRLG